MDRADQGVSAEDLSLFLIEMFPNIPIEVVLEKVNNAPPHERTRERMVNYFLDYPSPELAEEPGNEDAEAMEMVSLVPKVWEDRSQRPAEGDEMAKERERKRKMEEEDEALARQIYEEELRAAAAAQPQQLEPFSAKDVLQEANYLRQLRASSKMSPQSQSRPSSAVPPQPKPSAATPLGFCEQLEEVRRMRQRDWKESGGTGFTLFGKSPQVTYNADYRSQLQSARERHRNQWRNTRMGRKRVWTLHDIEEKRKEEEEAIAREHLASEGQRPRFGSLGMFRDPGRIGREALELTNEFRKKNGLPPLEWSQPLADIGQRHSKDMGDGRVPFGHQGFEERVRQFPMPHHSTAENVAMNQGISDVARAAVNGWIESPGHRRNLLSHSRWCGIGVYENAQGAFYLTQLFAG